MNELGVEKRRKDSSSNMAEPVGISDTKWNYNTLLPVFLLFVAIPISMVLWIGNIAFSKLRSGSSEVIPPTRWFAATLLCITFASWGLKRGSVNRSGALMGLVIAFPIVLGSYAFFISLLVFFVSSSQATKFRGEKKKKIEHDYKEGGQRNWLQALCNGGMAAQVALLYLVECGPGERPVDFTQDFRGSSLAMALLGAFACSNADTWASELAPVLSKSDPFLITSWRRVPKGVNGGVTLIGLVCSLLGGAMIGLGYWLTILYFVPTLSDSPVQWPLVPVAAIAGLIGSLIDSFIGATLQYSGMDKKTGKIVETPGPEVKYICGRRILDNHAVNIVSNIITGLITPRIAAAVWPR